MKRRLLIIALFLLLGAVVNVAVAWAILVTKDWKTVFPIEWRQRNSHCPREVPERWPRAPGYLDGGSFGVFVQTYAASRDSGRTSESFSLDVGRAGWPMVSLIWEIWSEAVFHEPNSPVPFTEIDEGHPNPTWWLSGIPAQLSTRDRGYGTRVRNHLPVRPIGPGFLANTLFYAAILWLVIPGPFVLRRFLRLRRGLCPACAYPMGESSVCTECGGAVLPGRALRG